MTLRLQNTEIRFAHPNIGPMCSFIQFENERELKKAINKRDNLYSIIYGGKMASITIDFMEIYDNYIHVIINYKVADDNKNNIYTYNCMFDSNLKKFLLSI